MNGRRPRADFTENLEAVAHGVRRLEQIQDPILREAVAAALRLHVREARPDTASRVRMRNTVLAALAPAKPTLGDRVYGAFALIGKPAPMLVRGLASIVVIAAMLGGAAVSSADSLPDDVLYSFKLAGEQVRLAVAIDAGDRASVELSIAEHRLDEAERLATDARVDDAIIATASYGSSLADAAADLASVESSDPRAAALVTQMQTSFTSSQVRVAAMAAKLATDPRTAGTAEVLGVLAATAAPSAVSPATKIADQAVAITARLSVVADDRVTFTDTRRAEAPRTSLLPRTEPPTAAPSHTEAPAPAHAQTAPPTAGARQAAEKAKEAAKRAFLAAEKAKRWATRSPISQPDPSLNR